jgi:hypothetical protein
MIFVGVQRYLFPLQKLPSFDAVLHIMDIVAARSRNCVLLFQRCIDANTFFLFRKRCHCYVGFFYHGCCWCTCQVEQWRMFLLRILWGRFWSWVQWNTLLFGFLFSFDIRTASKQLTTYPMHFDSFFNYWWIFLWLIV